jgi:protein involved in sex pheromone biosynthesis
MMKTLSSMLVSLGLILASCSQSCAQKTKNNSLQQINDPKNDKHITQLIDAKTWNSLFPNRIISRKRQQPPGLLFLSGIYKSGSPLPHFSE